MTWTIIVNDTKGIYVTSDGAEVPLTEINETQSRGQITLYDGTATLVQFWQLPANSGKEIMKIIPSGDSKLLSSRVLIGSGTAPEE